MDNSTKETKQAIAALKTARGQIDGILKMIDDSRYCIDVSNQIMAAQSLLVKANKIILIQHLHGCVLDAAGNEEDLHQKTDELVSVLDKLLKN